MKGTALLLCAITLAQAAQPQLTLRGKVCHCDPWEAVGVCAQYGSDNELITHENCNQFYKCAHGQPIAYFCPGTTLYNPLAETCDWPQNVECGDRPVVPAPEPEEGPGGQGNGTEDNGNGGSGNCNPEDAPALCAASGSDGVLVAHENCNWFYKCANGIPVAMHCDTNLLYNPHMEQCDWPYNVDCAGRPIVAVEIGGDNNGEVDCEDDNSNGDNGECNCNPAEAPAICAAPGSSGVLVAHENCRKFYKCDHGVPVAFPCHGILLYNPYTEQCDWPNNVDCGDRYCYPLEPGTGDIGGGGTDNGGTNNENSGSSNDNGGSSNDNGGGNCNCNPAEAPTICSADGSDGVLIAHEHCNKFYKCDHGVPVAMNCYGNLMYNPHTEQCDWPELVDCGDRPVVEVKPVDPVDPVDPDVPGTGGGSGACNCNPAEAPTICSADGSDGVLIAHEHCNKFYKCDHGVPVAMNCYGDLLYNPHTEQCDWPDKVDCGDRPVVEVKPVDPVDPVDPDVPGTGGGSGTCNCNPAEAPTICSADGSDGALIAHEHCNKFYKCDHGVPVAMNCYGNLMYNPHTEQCDWPELVDCGDRPVVEVKPVDPVDSVNPDVPGTGGGGGTCNCNPAEAPTICSADGSDGALIAHEHCNKFYKCDHGVPVAMNCYGDLLYNPHTEQCDWPDKVDCGDRPVVEVKPVDPVDPVDPDVPGTGGGSGTCNCNPAEAPTICSADGSDGALIAHEHCNKFYKCDHGVPVAMNCYGNLMYNPHTEQCDWPELVDCGDRPVVEVKPVDPVDPVNPDVPGTGGGGGTCNCNPAEAPTICSADGSDGALIAHEHCNKFYKCDHGVPVAMNCYGDLLYNPHTEQCDWPDKVDCGDRPVVEVKPVDPVDPVDPDVPGTGGGSGTCNCNPAEAPTICSADGSDGVLIAHEHCNKFYKCDHGVPVAMNCYGNLMYNPHTEQCDWPELVDCGDRPVVEVKPVDPVDPVDPDVPGTGGGSGTCNCNPAEAPTICFTDGSDGALIAHEHCNKFYKCDHGVPVAMNCFGDLLYNPQTEQCDWPDKVDCGDRPIVENNPGTGDNGDADVDDVGNAGDNNNDNTDVDCEETNSNNNCNCNPDEAASVCSVPGSDGTFVAHENCNQFYQCSHGIPVPKFCAGTLLYNPMTHSCLWPEVVDCGDRPIVENEGGNEDNGNSEDSSENGGTENGTCNCNPAEAPSICSAAGSDGVVIAHEHCNAFYRCAHGLPVTFHCGGDLLYDPHTERCNWPDTVECGGRPIVPLEHGPGEDEDIVEIEANCDPSQAPAICAASGSDGVLVAHENCDQYYKCTHGLPVPLNCSPNLLFNPNINNCDWPDNVECGDRIVPGVGGGDESCACNPREAPAICAGASSDGKLVAHEQCDQYWECVGGEPVARACPPSLLYEPHSQQCLRPAAVSCQGRQLLYSSLNKHLQARRPVF